MISDLKTRLLSTIAPSRMLALTAIHGMGGVGKSTTAADLAYDPDVQARFSDGILWVTLGHQPDLLSLLSDWIIYGLHDYNFRPTTVLAAKTHLHTLLQDKAVLIIIDDVWRDDHANAFAVGGSRCRVIMTTRDAIVARAVNADVYPLDVMQADQALALLQLRVGHALEGREREAALALSELVGYLPLALELAAGQVADGLPWSEFITALRKEIGDLRRLEIPGVDEVVEEGARKRLSLRASLQLSVNRLSDERRRRFAWLGVLPEDAAITARMAATLWDVHVSHATETLNYLRLKALLLAGVALPDGTPTYRVHDLLHHMALEILTSLPPAGLGLDLADVHVTLLHHYHGGARNGLWSTIPDDGYIHRYLTWHMEKAGRHDLIHALLHETSSDGGNAWYNKQDALGQLGWYLDDVRRAWHLAEADLSVSFATSPATPTPDDQRDGPALPVRYALVIASLNSLAHRIPHLLFARLVEARLWTPTQALAYACQMPYGTDRAWALRSLAPHLSYSLVQQALGFVLASSTEDMVSSDNPQVEAVATLGQRLVELGHADDIPRAVGMLTSEDKGEGALTRLLQHLVSLRHHEVALKTARAIKDPWTRARALLWAVGDMSGSERDAMLVEALAATTAIQDFTSRTPTLKFIAAQLPVELLEQGLSVARALPEHTRGKYGAETPRSEALSALIVRLAELGEIDTALRVAPEIGRDSVRAEALSVVVQRCAEIGNVQLATQVARSIRAEPGRARAFAAVMPYLAPREQERILAEALEGAHAATEPSDRAAALVALLLSMPVPDQSTLLKEVKDAIGMIESDGIRARLLAALVVRLDTSLLEETLTEAVAAARATEDSWTLLEVLKPPLLDLVERGHSDKVVIIAQDIARDSSSEFLLEEVVLRMAELGQPMLALEIATALPEQGHYVFDSPQTRLLERLMPQLVALGHFNAALAAAQSLQSASHRASALQHLTALVSGEQRDATLAHALAAARDIEDEKDRALALIFVGGLLDGLERDVVLAEAWEVARRIMDFHSRPWALAALADYVSDVERERVLRETLAIARTIADADRQARALVGLAQYMPPSDREQTLTRALAVARSGTNAIERGRGLVSVVPHLADVERDTVALEALAVVKNIKDEEQRAEVLMALAPHLMSESLQEALVIARQLPEHIRRGVKYLRAPALEQIVLRFVELGNLDAAHTVAREITLGSSLQSLVKTMAGRMGLVDEALGMAKAIGNPYYRVASLVEVVQQIGDADHGPLLGEALRTLTQVNDEEGRAHALRLLTPHLTSSLLQEATVIARALPVHVQGRYASPRSEAFKEIALRFAELGETDKAQAIVQEIESSTERMEALGALVRYLHDPDRDQALQAVVRAAQASGSRKHWKALCLTAMSLVELGDHDRALALARAVRTEVMAGDLFPSLALRLAELGNPSAALEAASLPDAAYRRASALEMLAEHWLNVGCPEQALDALEAIEPANREWPLRKLAPKLSHVPRARLYALWRETLPILAAQPRDHMLTVLADLGPILQVLGGTQALNGTASAILDAGSWWP